MLDCFRCCGLTYSGRTSHAWFKRVGIVHSAIQKAHFCSEKLSVRHLICLLEQQLTLLQCIHFPSAAPLPRDSPPFTSCDPPTTLPPPLVSSSPTHASATSSTQTVPARQHRQGHSERLEQQDGQLSAPHLSSRLKHSTVLLAQCRSQHRLGTAAFYRVWTCEGRAGMYLHLLQRENPG